MRHRGLAALAGTLLVVACAPAAAGADTGVGTAPGEGSPSAAGRGFGPTTDAGPSGPQRARGAGLLGTLLVVACAPTAAGADTGVGTAPGEGSPSASGRGFGPTTDAGPSGPSALAALFRQPPIDDLELREQAGLALAGLEPL